MGYLALFVVLAVGFMTLCAKVLDTLLPDETETKR